MLSWYFFSWLLCMPVQSLLTASRRCVQTRFHLLSTLCVSVLNMRLMPLMNGRLPDYHKYCIRIKSAALAWPGTCNNKTGDRREDMNQTWLLHESVVNAGVGLLQVTMHGVFNTLYVMLTGDCIDSGWLFRLISHLSLSAMANAGFCI